LNPLNPMNPMNPMNILRRRPVVAPAEFADNVARLIPPAS
jgi:hypothetical protein